MQGLNGRGTVSEREGEQASGKPGTNGIIIRRVGDSRYPVKFFLEISWLLSGQLGYFCTEKQFNLEKKKKKPIAPGRSKNSSQA